jgi:hypothetical protein
MAEDILATIVWLDEAEPTVIPPIIHCKKSWIREVCG